ncbi:hypothetical protein [Rhodohalobacter sp. 614A]|uniref:hypothetical protein n=1 Tax=Rhodohalobacter sp. 614A TaxID=2908649 RepID=UPI001F3B04B5|nr:hypothetical protein [Rhodohalobacter sp. 614A]
MKKMFCSFALLLLFLSGCTATMYTASEEQYRERSLTTESISTDGIALLPITGANQTFNSVVSMAADSVLRSYQFSRYAGSRQVSNQLNNRGLVRDYQEMINNYHSSGMIDNSQMKKIGEAIEARYLLKIQIGSLNSATDTESDYDGDVYTTREKNVRIYGLLWDATNGNVVWEGASTALVEEEEYTVIRQSDREFYEAATSELIHKLLSPRS